jgi:hypothetical protein
VVALAAAAEEVDFAEAVEEVAGFSLPASPNNHQPATD